MNRAAPSPKTTAAAPKEDVSRSPAPTHAADQVARPGSPAPAGAWRAVAFVMFAVAWGGNEFTPLLVMYRQNGDFSPVVADGLLAAYIFGIVPALLIGGPLSDRFGRRPLLLPAAPLALAGSLVIAAAPASFVAVGIGRVLCGLALGLGMAVGAAWISELSRTADAGAGPRRASLSLTTGFLVGAGAAAALAQWAPLPERLSYGVHIVIALLASLAILRAPETRRRRTPEEAGSLLADLKVPAVAHRRFLFVVIPVAPWVFGAAGSAYAVLPGLMADHSGGLPIALSGLLTVICLGAGTVVQMLGKRIDTHRSARASALAMGIILVGMVIAAFAASRLTLPLAIAGAAVLGAGYGLAMIAGLSEVQRIAGPDDLAGLTSVFYSFSYLGFFVPVTLTALSAHFTFAQLFTAGAVMAALCGAVVVSAWRTHLPTGEGARAVSWEPDDAAS